MRLATYNHQQQTRFGAVTADGVVHLSTRLPQFASLRALLAADALEDARRAATGAAPDAPLASVTLLPPLPDASKILCIGLNYKSHVAETGRDLPPQPSVFLRTQASVVGQGAPMLRAKASTNFDFEGELTVVIGRRGRHIAEADALSHIAGYTCFNDGSLRDFQKHSVTAGKNFDASGACGPWIVTADEVPDPTALTLCTRLNGVEVQRSTTDLLIYSIPRIVSYLSSFMALEPGDLIATGTPAGVGARRTPPLWMKAGDTIEVEISGIGTLRNPIADET